MLFEERLLTYDCCPLAIISPQHAAGVALCRIAQSHFEKRFKVFIPFFQHSDLIQFKDDNALDCQLRDLLQRANGTDSILILDDVLVSGARFDRYEHSLREIPYHGRIHYLVGFARPEDKKAWDQIARYLRHRDFGDRKPNTVHYLELLILPNWDEKRCPWCAELEIYRTSAQKTLPSEIVERFSRLQSAVRDIPMIDDLFFKPSAGSPLTLTINSILLPHPASQADVFCAAANLVQTLRCDPEHPKNLTSKFPELRVLHAEHYLGKHFNDAVIRAAILRSAHRTELEYHHFEHEAKRAAKTIEVITNVESDVNCISLELAIAIAQGKLPRLNLNDETCRMLKNPDFRMFYENLLK